MKVADAVWRHLKSPRRTLELTGFDVALDPTDLANAAVESLNRGIALLEQVDGLVARRVRRGCSRILVRERAFARYWPLPQAIVLGQSDLAKMSNGEVALLLVHEATHARLASLGLTARRFGLDRIERVCLRRARALAQQFPNPEPWIARIDERLTNRLWNRRAVARRVEEEFSKRGFPGWAARLVARVATRKHPV